MKNKVYALGYGNWKDLRDFVELLKKLNVNVLVDVRRFPKSKNSQFTMENLKAELPKHGIKYEYLGEALGGFRRGGYDKHVETEEYKSGIRRLLEISEENTVAIMCVEQKSKYCHRRFIIETLVNLDVEVLLIE